MGFALFFYMSDVRCMRCGSLYGCIGITDDALSDGGDGEGDGENVGVCRGVGDAKKRIGVPVS
jgi:hypothetical protein